MTSLVAWLGVDSRGPASLYLASDSRLSWGGGQSWDRGRKVFAARASAEVLGYFGDVLFPSQVLGQIIDLVDGGVLLRPADSPGARRTKISQLITSSFSSLPTAQQRPFTAIYCTREGEGMTSAFHVSILSWAGAWHEEWLALPSSSGVVRWFGSGQAVLETWYTRWSRTPDAGTSRIVFGAFCDALQSSEDPLTGGPPQLAGLYRKGPGRDFGVIYRGERYLLGLPAVESEALSETEWRNPLFERCDWRTREPLSGAQRHRRPRGLGLA